MRKFKIKQSWWYDRPACDCCEGLYDEAWDLLEGGELISTHYSEEGAKAALVDLLVFNSEIELTQEVEDYPG